LFPAFAGRWLSTGKQIVKNVKPFTSVFYRDSPCLFCVVKLTRPSPLTLLTAALLVLLPALAVLQYRWVGQVSEAERDRMERNVRTAAFQFRGAFDTEILER
jgi:hypothetical protein